MIEWVDDGYLPKCLWMFSVLTYLSLLKSHGNYQCFLLQCWCRIFLVTSALGANTESWSHQLDLSGCWCSPLVQHLAITHWASTSKHPTTFIKTFHYFTALQCHNSARNISLWCQQTYYNFKQAIIHFNIVNVLQAYFFKNKVLRPPSHFSIMIITLYILILQPCHISLVLSLLWLTGTDWLKMLLALLMLLWCCWAGHQSAGRIFRQQPGCGLA